MEKKSNAKKIIVGIMGFLVLALLIVGMLWLKDYTKKDTVEGEKSITVQVKAPSQDFTFEETYKTTEEYLGNFLESENLIGFETSQYGRYIKSAKGIEANDAEQSWWCIWVNGESSVTGVDEIVLEDGSTYTLELKIGW